MQGRSPPLKAHFTGGIPAVHFIRFSTNIRCPTAVESELLLFASPLLPISSGARHRCSLEAAFRPEKANPKLSNDAFYAMLCCYINPLQRSDPTSHPVLSEINYFSWSDLRLKIKIAF
jgi:hypothetical protein